MAAIETITRLFPGLLESGFRITSEADTKYNCIAWAVGRSGAWWWPSEDGFWPNEVPLNESTESFVALFEGLGYTLCDDGAPEVDREKIALYAIDGKVKHAARQLADGTCTSKLGELQDIQHDRAESVCGSEYGEIVRYMARIRSTES